MLDHHIERRNNRLKEYEKDYETRVERERKKQELLRHQELLARQQQARPPGYLSSRNSHPRFDLIDAKFEAVEWLGGGQWTAVYEVQETTTCEVYACKRIYFQKAPASTSTDIKKRAQDEVKIMKKLKHDHIVSCLFHVEQPDWIAIFMTPVADSDLERYLESCESEGHPVNLTSPIFQWFGSLLQALDYAHQKNIRHRDIKLRNILIKAGRPYLADFGSAVDFTEQATSNSNSSVLRGTALYFAPENNPGEDHGRPADVFALGCVFSEMLTVANNRTLEDLSKYMRKPNEASWARKPYRENLDMLKEWLANFRVQGARTFADPHARGNRNNLLIWVIEAMIYKDKEKRLTARQGWEYLLRDTGLFCPTV